MSHKESITFEHERLHIDDLKKYEMPWKKSNELNDIVLKFTNRPNILNNLLDSKKYVFNKRGISYKPNLKQNITRVTL